MKSSSAARWSAVAVFGLASTWNYLDRQVLAAAAPRIRAEFHLTETGYGWILSAFSFAYMLAAPVIGWLLDRVGIEAGIVCAVALWSVSALLCGWSKSLWQLMAARGLLGIFESAGVPAAGKLNSTYLPPKNRAIGAAVTQVGLTIGGVGAPLLVAMFTGWRSPFFICAALGFGWIPVWVMVRRGVSPYEKPRPAGGGYLLYKDPRLITIAAANMLWMGIYSLWSNWTTEFLSHVFHLDVPHISAFAWFPPIASTLGAFAGGWISKAAITRGRNNVDARIFGTLIAAGGCLATVLVPLCPTPLTATLAIAASYFWVTAGSVNLYTIPVDIWGGEYAGSAISALVFSYGLLQTVISPAIGWLVHRFGFTPVCWLFALTPFTAWLLLRRVIPRPERREV